MFVTFFRRLSEGNQPFEARLTIPKLLIHAKYTSSGVLIIIPASGSGDFDAVFDGVTADVKGLVSISEKPTGMHLRVDKLDLNLSIKKPRLSVSKIFNNNRILSKRRTGSQCLLIFKDIIPDWVIFSFPTPF